MNKKGNELLLCAMGDIDENYVQEYIDSRSGNRVSGKRFSAPSIGRRLFHPGKIRFGTVAAAVMIALFGTVSLAASLPSIRHFFESFANERQVIVQNFDEIKAQYAVFVEDTQECDGVVGTLNSAVVEDNHLLLQYTFDWSGLEEAQDGSFHTWFLPWFFYITEGDHVLCQSEYTEGLHTQSYVGEGSDAEDVFSDTFIYCIDLGGVTGSDLIGKELTVRLLYQEGGEGFVSTFTPKSCFSDKSWDIGRTYRFQEHEITLNSVSESALYVTLNIDCDTIGHLEDSYSFLLADELGNGYEAYPYGDGTVYWFTKPANAGSRLTLQVIRSGLTRDPYGQITDDSYEVLFEIPIER